MMAAKALVEMLSTASHCGKARAAGRKIVNEMAKATSLLRVVCIGTATISGKATAKATARTFFNNMLSKRYSSDITCKKLLTEKGKASQAAAWQRRNATKGIFGSASGREVDVVGKATIHSRVDLRVGWAFLETCGSKPRPNLDSSCSKVRCAVTKAPSQLFSQPTAASPAELHEHTFTSRIRRHHRRAQPGWRLSL
jgi:hypothetical protein